MLSAIMFFALYLLAYSKVDKFFEAELNDNLLTLKYASPSKDKIITTSEIKSVTFGSTSRGLPACFIVFHSKTGGYYQSTFLDSEILYCKTKRNEISALLNI
jgi:hypothetical protein